MNVERDVELDVGADRRPSSTRPRRAAAVVQPPATRAAGRRSRVTVLAAWCALAVVVLGAAPGGDYRPAAPAFAQAAPAATAAAGVAPADLAPVGQFGGLVTAAAKDGKGHVFVSMGRSILVWDFTAPARPVLIGQSPLLAFEPSDVAVAGSFVYAVASAGSSGVAILDVSDPRRPVEVWSNSGRRAQRDAPSYAQQVTVSGDFAYLSAHSDILVVDVSDKRAPIQVALIQPEERRRPSVVFDLVVHGKRLFVATWDGLLVYDVSTPATPVLESELDPGWQVKGLVIAGPVYVIEAPRGLAPTRGGRLRVILRPEDRQLSPIATLDLDDIPTAVAYADDHVHIGTQPLAGGAEGGRLLVVDTADLSKPIITATHALPAAPRDVVAVGARMLAAGGGLYAVETAGAAKPSAVQTVAAPSDVMDVAVQDGEAVLAAGADGVVVVDVSRPGAPSERGRVDTPGKAMRLARSGNHVYVADGPGGLRVVDVSDPEMPREVGFVAMPEEAVDVEVRGDTAFVACDTAGILAVDVADPARPVVVGGLDTPGRARDLAVQGRYLYVADFATLRTVDAADPTALRDVGAVAEAAWGVDVTASRLLIAIGERVTVLDTAIPDAPASIARVTGAWGADVAAHGTRVYAMNSDSVGVWVIDLDDPTQPRPYPDLLIEGRPFGAAGSGSYAFFALSRGGLAILGPPPSEHDVVATPTPGVAATPIASPAAPPPGPWRAYLPDLRNERR